MDTKTVMALYDQYILRTSARTPHVFTKGKGCRIWDIHGREYLDFFPGWGVSGLGHCPSEVVRSIRTQAGKVLHVSNNYHNVLQAKLAKEIVESSFDAKVFFANSGAEANEAAVKLIRAFGHPDRYEILSMTGSFHGRTLATVTMTGQAKYKEGFGPLPQGFREVPFNDAKAVESALRKETIAIFVELIQGEGGVCEATPQFIQTLRKICDEKQMFLVFDEVQTGVGRTGKLFCFQHYGVTPDIMTLAKTLGGGVPIGAAVVSTKYADVFKPGMHASTFAGSPLVCAASLAVFKTIRKEKLLLHIQKMGEYLVQELKKLKEDFALIREIRGKGLMIGVELNGPGKKIVEACYEKGLLINCTQEKVLRIFPPYIVKKKEIDRALSVLREALSAA